MRDWWQSLAQYDLTMVHRPGVLNVLPDLLSRLYEPATWLTRPAVAKKTKRFKNIVAALDANPISEPWDIPDVNPSAELVDDPWEDNQRVLQDGDAPVQGLLPIDDSSHQNARKSFYEWMKHCSDKSSIDDPIAQMDYVDRLHSRTHGGTETMFQTAWREGYYWPNLRKQCAAIAESCDRCLQYAIRRVGFHPMKPIVCRLPGDHYAIDYAGPFLTTFDGYNYVLLVVDMASRYVVLRPTKTRLETEAAEVLFQIAADFGIPKILQSDNDSAFTGKVVTKLGDQFQYIHRKSAAYNPVQNGAAEKQVDLMKRKLRRFIQGELRDWVRFLPAIQVAMNCSVSARHRSTPFAIMFGRTMNLLKDYTKEPIAPLNVEALYQRMKRISSNVFDAAYKNSKEYADAYAQQNDSGRRIIPDDYPPGTTVMIINERKSSSTDQTYLGPYIIVEKTPSGYRLFHEETRSMLQRIVPVNKMKVINYHETKATLRDKSKITKIMRKVTDHRGDALNRYYLVVFADKSTSWVHHSNFRSMDLIHQYWRNVFTRHKS